MSIVLEAVGLLGVMKGYERVGPVRDPVKQAVGI